MGARPKKLWDVDSNKYHLNPEKNQTKQKNLPDDMMEPLFWLI